MYQLKNTNITYPQKRITYYYGKTSKGKISKKPLKNPRTVSANITLRELLEYCLDPDDWTIDCPDVNLGQFRATNASIAKILDELRDKYRLFSRFRNGTLYCGFSYDARYTATYEYVFNKCQPNAIIDDSELEWTTADKTNIKVVAKLMGLNNTFEEVTVGDTDGAQRSIFAYWDGKTTPKPDIRKLAEEDLSNAKYDGYRGSFETFGLNNVMPGDVVRLKSDKFPERDGDYLVNGVSGNFGMDGNRQTIKIGNKI
jgi:hypothetical protein